MKELETEFDYEVEYYYFTEQEKQDNRDRALEMLFKKSNFGDDDSNWFVNCFLWVKCFICLALERMDGTHMNYDAACVMSYDESHYPGGTNWTSCWISTKLFSGWQVGIIADGT